MTIDKRLPHSHLITSTGKCTLCNKVLTGNRLYICKECEDKLQKELYKECDVEMAEDCVKREPIQKAIKDMLFWINGKNRGNADYFIVDQIEEIIKKLDIDNLPSVTPQPKRGKWIEDAKTYYKMLNERGLGVDEYTPYFTDDIACSVCLAKYSCIDNETQFFKFCPNCGADMRGVQDEQW